MTVIEMDEMDEIERRLASVEARLTAAVGDRSLCDLSRSGPSLEAKELEGAMSALLEARRRVLHSTDSSDVVVRSVLDGWRAELSADATRGAVWQAYRTGGVAELEAVLHILG